MAKESVEIHVHLHLPVEYKDILRILERIENTMAKSPEVQAMQDAVTAALDNITTDIQTLLTRSTGLSEEDKAALTQIAERAASVASIFDSGDGGGTPV